ncbi:MAG TPA: DinB family protein [Terriglobales bacterium]|jgi:uncharacterized damage-inducible protein DinB|nr:DinB family protein [Terriglobales bacterium]
MSNDIAQYLDKVRGRTLRVVHTIPPDKLEWSPKAGRFTLGDLARHIASAGRCVFVENALGRPSRYPGHGRELADGVGAVVAYLERLHAESLALLGALSTERLEAKVTTLGGTEVRAWKLLRLMAEHEAHHRGQIYFALGLLDVPTPPLYGMTEPEVAARSRRA